MRGTEVVAILYSLIESAQLAGVSPHTYLHAAIKAALRGVEIPLPQRNALSRVPRSRLSVVQDGGGRAITLTISHSYWASEFYKGQRQRGATHQPALRALAFKWARILFRYWKDRTTYDESRYVKHLKMRESPLITGEQIHAQSA